MIFWLKTLRDNKVRAAKDDGRKFENRLAASFSGIVRCPEKCLVLHDSRDMYDLFGT